MECGNPPASTDSVGERKELALTSRPSGLTPGGAYSSRPGLISFPQVSLPYAHFPRDDMGGTCQSYPPENGTEKNMIDDLMNPNGLANPQTDASLRNVGNNVSNFPRVSQTSHSKMSTRESCQSIDGSNMVPAHCLMDGGVVSAEYQDSEVHMNYMPARGDASSGYSVNTQGREARTSTRKLGEALSFRHNSRVRETLRSSSSLPPLAGRTVNSQTDAGGLSSLAHNLSCQNFVCNEAGNIRGVNAMLNAMPSPSLQTPEADMQGAFSTKFNMYSRCQGDLAASPLPCSSTSIIYPECTSGPALTSVSSKPTLIACQPISNQKHNYLRRSSMKVSSDSIMNSHLLRHQRSSIKHAQLGKLISRSEGSTTRVVDTVPFPLNVKPMGKQIPLSEDCTTQVVDSSPFPVRVQPVGTSQVCLPAQVNPCRLSNTTGQPQHDGPAQLPKDFPRADCADAQVIPAPKVDIQSQASSVLYQSSLKRRPNENSLSAPSSQRRRMIPPPPRHPSVPHQQHYIPAPVPASPLHIKWRGFDGLPKPIGQKCFLCKRDLSFTAGGHVYQPAVPPAVAILPCGHTFHDHCMQTITPQDQSKNPPCIPCAIDET